MQSRPPRASSLVSCHWHWASVELHHDPYYNIPGSAYCQVVSCSCCRSRSVSVKVHTNKRRAAEAMRQRVRVGVGVRGSEKARHVSSKINEEPILSDTTRLIWVVIQARRLIFLYIIIIYNNTIINN